MNLLDFNPNSKHFFLKDLFPSFGGGSPRQVIREVATPDQGGSGTPLPTPPTKGDAARNIAPQGLARLRRMQGRASTQTANRGSLEDQISSLLGTPSKLGG